MQKHLAIFSPEAIEQILLGKKTIETRFGKAKQAPYGQVSSGDTVYIKPSGKPVLGQFLVKKVIFFDNLDKQDWDLIKNNYGESLSLGSDEADKKYFKDHAEARYGVIIFIERVEQFITEPLTYSKSDRRGWVVLED